VPFWIFNCYILRVRLIESRVCGTGQSDLQGLATVEVTNPVCGCERTVFVYRRKIYSPRYAHIRAVASR
jgi:hypothetical protein